MTILSTAQRGCVQAKRAGSLQRPLNLRQAVKAGRVGEDAVNRVIA